MAKKFEIQNSTAEFLTFIAKGKEDGVQVAYRDDLGDAEGYGATV